MTALPLLTDRAPEDAPTGAGILTCDQGNLPLIAMDVSAELSGLVAGMTVRQTFRNPHGSPIQATYIFPLPDRAAVTGLTVTIGDRRIIGHLEERRAARDAYDSALAAGRRAAILEEERPDVFTTRLGNLAPGEQATVELSLAGPVPCEFGEATFRVPLVVAQRYIGGSPLEGDSVGDGVALDTDAVPDASRITPPVLLPGWPNPVRLSVRVSLDPAGLEVADLRSSLHTATVSGGLPGRLTVELRPGHRLDRDFILRYRVGTTRVGVGAMAVRDASGDEGTFVVTVTPPATAGPPPPRDVVLVLDRSGSMAGWKMVAARRAAARLIDSMTAADRFAVMAFDNVVEQPPGLDSFPALAPASDRNRYRSIEWLARVEARGGTEMLEPLTLAHRALAASGGRNACCILITDGQVGNEDQLLSALHGMRLFTVGIDQAVNAGLLHRLAGQGGGRCELVESEDRLDQVMTDLHRGIANPVFEDVAVRFEGLDVLPGSVTPPGPADVFAGVPLVISGRFRGRPGGLGTVVVAIGRDGRPAMEAPVQAASNPAAAAVWARGHLRDLEDRYAAGGAGLDTEALADQITATSLRHQVLCRFTAFVAVDEAGLAVSGDLHRIVQPVECAAGWRWSAPGAFAAAAATTPRGAGPEALPTAVPLQVGPPQPIPGFQPAAPAPPAGSPPPVRANRRLGPSTRAVEAPPSRIDVGSQRCQSRLEDLLDGVDRLVGPQTGADTARLAEDAWRLVKEFPSERDPRLDLATLEALAVALSAGDIGAAHTLSARLRAAFGWDEGRRSRPRRRFWR